MRILFPALVALAAVFVWLTGAELPALVASHFTLAGRADGFMPRGRYLGLMLGLVVIVPVSTVAVGWLVGRLPPQLVNLPHREHWLAPERRDATLRSLCRWLAAFATVLVVFLCFLHWRVVQANAAPSGVLVPAAGLGIGLLVFLGAMLVWCIALYRRFARVP